MSTIFFIIAIIVFILLIAFNNSIKDKEKQRLQGARNQEKYPNFRNALKRIYQDTLQLYADNGKVVTYKIHTRFRDRKVGETFFILGLLEDKNFLQQSYEGYDNAEIITDKYYLQTKSDLSIEEYLKILEKVTLEIVSDSRYIKSTSGFSI